MNYQPNSGFIPQQQNSLPFDPSRLMSQPMNFRQDDPPCVPANINVHHQFNHLIVPVCAIIANLVGQTAQNHAGRTFLFNQLSQNNYNNNDFSRVVATTFDLLELGMYKNQYRHTDEGVNDAVAKAISLASAINFQAFPELQRYVQQDVYNDAITNLNALQNIHAELSHFRGTNIQQPQQGIYSQQQRPQQNTQMHGGRFDNRQQPNAVYQRPIGGTGSLFNSGGQAAPYTGNAPVVNVESDRFASYKPASVVSQNNHFQKSPVMQEPIQQVYIPQNVPAIIEEIVELTVADWSTSEHQPYLPTVNPDIQKLVFNRTNIDSVDVVIATIAYLSENEMNKDEHSTSMISIAMRESFINNEVDLSKNFRSTVSLVLNSNSKDLGATYDEEECVKIRTIRHKSFLAETSKEHLIFKAKLLQAVAAQNNDYVQKAFVVQGILATPVITKEDEFEFMGRLSDCKTYSSISKVLKKGLEDTKLIGLVAKIDEVFTKEINSILRNKLSLTIDVTSFMEDAHSMIGYLEREVSLVVAKRYQQCEDDFVEIYLDQSILDKDTLEAFYVNYGVTDFDNESVDPPVVVDISYISQRYAMVFLGLHSHEMCVGLQDMVATGLNYKENMSMWLLAKELLDRNNQKVAHTLIITADEQIYELHVGLLGEDFYTISKYE